jgi:hypothetical protein
MFEEPDRHPGNGPWTFREEAPKLPLKARDGEPAVP